MPAVCQSMDLQVFLSKQNISLPVVSSEPRARLSAFPLPGQTAVRTLARSLAAGIEELVGGQSASMMDTVIGRLLQQASDFAGHGREPLSEEDLVRQGDGAGLAALDVREETLTSFTTPICDTFINLFDLKEKNNWLRRQAILLILQQLLGGTIERYVSRCAQLLAVANLLRAANFARLLHLSASPNSLQIMSNRSRTRCGLVAS